MKRSHGVEEDYFLQKLQCTSNLQRKLKEKLT